MINNEYIVMSSSQTCKYIGSNHYMLCCCCDSASFVVDEWSCSFSTISFSTHEWTALKNS